jgi:hypothetical protein
MQMTPFQYADFYDVPRMIILPVRGKWVFGSVSVSNIRFGWNADLD